MQSTAGGICLTPMFLGGQESGLSGTAWLGVVSTISTAMGCAFHGICLFLTVKLRVELSDLPP